MNHSWRSRVGEALVLLLGIAVVARVITIVMKPALPGIVILLLLCGLFVLLIRRH